MPVAPRIVNDVPYVTKIPDLPINLCKRIKPL